MDNAAGVVSAEAGAGGVLATAGEGRISPSSSSPTISPSSSDMSSLLLLGGQGIFFISLLLLIGTPVLKDSAGKISGLIKSLSDDLMEYCSRTN